MRNIKKVMLNNEQVLLILFIMIFITSMIGSSFAFFSSLVVGKQNVVEIGSASLGSMSISNSNIDLYVSAEAMAQDKGRNDYSSFTSKDGDALINLNFENGDSDYGTYCTYDLVYEPDIVYYKSEANNLNLREFAIVGYSKIISGSNDYVSYSGSFAETDLTSVSEKITLVKDAFVKVMGAGSEAQVGWDITIKYYNLAINQDDNANKTFGGLVKVDNLNCKYVSEGESNDEN